MAQSNSHPRPSAQSQQRQARGLVVVAATLTVCLLGGVAALWGVISDANAHRPGAPNGATPPTITEPEAPAEPEKPEVPADDERAADLALDPNRTDGWNFEGNGKKTVYLTFDDGPSENTQRVLDVLDQYGAKATFFVTGHRPEYREKIKEAYDKGHTIGMHTFTHDYADVYASEDAYFSDLEKVAEVVKEQIGYVPFLVRFPGGASNTISANYCKGIMSKLVEDVPARGYQFYDWNVSSVDATGTNVAVSKIVESACNDAYTNAMILFHDSDTKSTTPEALPQIIEYYQERGYAFEAITRESFVCHHGTNN